MDARLCVGKYAVRPYCFEGLNLKVFCAEELCYALKENAFLLDTDVMSDYLTEWLSQECGLSELPEELYEMIHKKGSLSAFVARILEYTAFYDEEVIQKTVQILKRGSGLNGLEKRKLRIDGLVAQRKYLAAVREYDALIMNWREAAGKENPEKKEDERQDNDGGAAYPGSEVYAALLHNKAVALAGLMRYQEASECFLASYEADAKQESLKCYLAAKRMELNDKDYIDFVASVPEYSEHALALEKEIEILNEKWQQEADCRLLAERRNLRRENENDYLNDNRRVVRVLKDDYRSMVE